MAETPANLLIVDDLPENLLALEALIRQDGCVVHRAASGDAALALLLEHEFALAILDVQMPGMTGFELAELMRGTEKTRHIPIVFVTAGRDFDHAFKGYESGAVDVLYKPLDAYAVQSKVGVFVGLYRQRQEVRRQLAELKESRRQQQMLLTQLQTTQVELQQAVQTRDNFMSMVAHELRTPLGALSIGIEVRQRHLHKGNHAYFQPERMATMLASDLRKVRSMARLIEDLLDVSRIQNGKLSVRPAPFDLSQLVQRVTRDVTNDANEGGITLEAEPGIFGSWDEFRLEQVVINLLTNALRYGCGQPIDVRVARVDANAEVSVRDRGIGIVAAEHGRIFEPFVRVANRSSAAGLGLGLYIVRQLVEAHGGSIRVASTPGEGSVFTVTLPLALAATAGADAEPGAST